MQETQEARVQSLGWEDLLEEVMATHSSILAWEISWTEKPGGLQSKGSQRVGHNWSDLACMHILNPVTLPYCLPLSELILQLGKRWAWNVKPLRPIAERSWEYLYPHIDPLFVLQKSRLKGGHLSLPCVLEVSCSGVIRLRRSFWKFNFVPVEWNNIH